MRTTQGNCVPSNYPLPIRCGRGGTTWNYRRRQQLQSCVLQCSQSLAGKRHDWILTLISPCMPSRMGLSFFYRILGAMDISLVDTSLAGFLSIHLLIDLLIICHMFNLNSTASGGKLCLLLQWCLVWILALPPAFLWISFIFPEGRILYPPFPGLRKDELK